MMWFQIQLLTYGSMHLDSHYILNHCVHSNVGYRSTRDWSSPLPDSTRGTCCAARFAASCNKGCDLNWNVIVSVVLRCCRILGVSTVPVSTWQEECVYYRICTYCILSYVNLFYIKYQNILPSLPMFLLQGRTGTKWQCLTAAKVASMCPTDAYKNMLSKKSMKIPVLIIFYLKAANAKRSQRWSF